MPTLKNFKLRNGKMSADNLEELRNSASLPFTATGWKSTQNSDLVGGKELSQPTKQEAKEESSSKPKFSEEELYALNKSEQVALLGEHGVSGKEVPRKEKERVELLLKLLK